MISRTAVREYLAERAKSHTWLKKVPRPALWAVVRRKLYGSGWYFKTRPYLHQLVCFYLGLKHARFLFLLDMGLGKTKIVLDLFAYRRAAGQAQKMLVVVPNDINVDGWTEEVAIHSDLRVVPLVGSTVNRWKALTEIEADVYVVHYPGLLYMLSRKRDKKMKQDPKLVRKMVGLIDTLVLDEVHKTKDTKTTTYSVTRALAKRVPYTYGLTGTPFGKEPLDLYGQFCVVDGGTALGPTIGLFKAAFYKEIWDPWLRLRFRKKLKRVLFRKLKTSSIRYRDSECGDVPKVVHNVHAAPWPVENHTYYKKLFESAEEQNRAERENVWHTARGMTAGYWRVKDEEGKESIVYFPANPKLDAVEELVTALPEGRKLIVFYEYIPSGNLIQARMKKLGVRSVHISGATKDKVSAIRSFKEDPAVRVLVGNWRIIGTGGNLQVANYGAFFESPSSPIQRRQCEKRFSGARQMNYPVAFIYDLVVKASYDVGILKALKEGEDLFQSIIEGEKN